MRISDWSSDLCSSDLDQRRCEEGRHAADRPGEESSRLREATLLLRLQEEAVRLLLAELRRYYVRRPVPPHHYATVRSEERRVGTEWFRTGRSRWSPDH